LNDIKDTDMMI